MNRIAALFSVLCLGVGLSFAHLIGLLNTFIYVVTLPLALVAMYGIILDMRWERSKKVNDFLISVGRIAFMATAFLYAFLTTSYMLDGTFFMLGSERVSRAIWVQIADAQMGMTFFICVIGMALIVFCIQLWDNRSLFRRPVNLLAAL